MLSAISWSRYRYIFNFCQTFHSDNHSWCNGLSNRTCGIYFRGWLRFSRLVVWACLKRLTDLILLGNIRYYVILWHLREVVYWVRLMLFLVQAVRSKCIYNFRTPYLINCHLHTRARGLNIKTVLSIPNIPSFWASKTVKMTLSILSPSIVQVSWDRMSNCNFENFYHTLGELRERIELHNLIVPKLITK